MAVFHDGYKLYYPVYGDNHAYHKPDSPFAVLKGPYRIFTDTVLREHPPADVAPKLFYLPDDPGESRDLSDEKPEIVKKLKGMLDSWFEKVLSQYREAAKVTLTNPED